MQSPYFACTTSPAVLFWFHPFLPSPPILPEGEEGGKVSGPFEASVVTVQLKVWSHFPWILIFIIWSTKSLVWLDGFKKLVNLLLKVFHVWTDATALNEESTLWVVLYRDTGHWPLLPRLCESPSSFSRAHPWQTFWYCSSFPGAVSACSPPHSSVMTTLLPLKVETMNLCSFLFVALLRLNLCMPVWRLEIAVY